MKYAEFFGSAKDVQTLLRVPPNSGVEETLHKALLEPLGEFLASGGKKFRTQVLEFAFKVADEGRTPAEEAQALLEKGAFIIESIHAATMVIDDIEDGSEQRRGKPCLHRQLGMPVALNAGSWLYFWPLERLQHWGLPPEKELRIYRLCTESLVQAHFGQAIDVSVPIDETPQEKVWDLSLAAMELKTGALMGLAAAIGAALAGASAPDLALLREFGVSFGVTLQMFEDVSNLFPRGQAPDLKQYEDLKLRRAGWVWAVAANYSSPGDYARFREAVKKLPDVVPVESWLEEQALAMRAKAMAVENLEASFGPLEERLGGAERQHWIQELRQRLTQGYRSE